MGSAGPPKGSSLASNLAILSHQLFFSFRMSLVQGDAIHRADLLALGFVVMADALGAQVRVYDVDLFALGNGLVRAFGFADVAIDAVVGDDQGHAGSCRGVGPGHMKNVWAQL